MAVDAGYRHTQFGYVTTIGLAVAASLCGYVALAAGSRIAVGLAALMVTCGVLLSTLATSVRDGRLECWFGPGLIRRTIDLREIADVSIVRNPWYLGWGIRATSRGWLWNVSGTRGIELHFVDGRRFRIGSDEPDRLAAAIRAQLGDG